MTPLIRIWCLKLVIVAPNDNIADRLKKLDIIYSVYD